MFDLRFLADMNISPLSVKRLRERGWDIFRVSEVMEPSAKDTAILEYARQENRVIITQDLDFSKLLALRGFDKPSLIRIQEYKEQDMEPI
jgi:predicted nuclease of predicted toxin-antitoxin system